MLRTALVLLLTLSGALSTAGCDSGLGSAQRLFDDQALLSRPAGFTEIEIENGVERVVSEDSDDWRLGPAFAVNTQVIQRPAPNPVRPSQEFTLTVSTNGVAGGLTLYRMTARGDLRLVDFRPEAADIGFYSFTLTGNMVDEGVDGLYRLVLQDGRNRVVTYGDILVVE